MLAGAWHVEAFARTKRLPKLKALLRKAGQSQGIPRQTPEEQSAFLIDFFGGMGFKVERHDKPLL